MTSKELHKQKIIPLRQELERLEREYEALYRKECGERNGVRACCDNCAFSCVLYIDNHNYCMGEKCTCCNDWCYTWTPENEVSKFLRQHYHYDSETFKRLENIFGYNFLKKCDNPNNVAMVMEVLKLSAKFNGKMED